MERQKELIKAAEAHVSEIKHAITNREEILILAAYEAGAQCEADRDKWISVADRLPEADKSFVLVSAGQYNVILIMWYGLDAEGDNNWFYNECVAKKHLRPNFWKPLPTPPSPKTQ